MRKTTVSIAGPFCSNPNGTQQEASIHWAGHTPSWLTYCENGSATLRIRTCQPNEQNAGWVSLDAAEHSGKSSKNVMLTLDQAEAIVLRDMLNAAFPKD